MPARGNEKPHVENRVKRLPRRGATPVPRVPHWLTRKPRPCPAIAPVRWQVEAVTVACHKLRYVILTNSYRKEKPRMRNPTTALLRANLKQLKLPTMLAEFDKLGREAAEGRQTFEQDLLRLTELDVSARAAHALTHRIKQAGFLTGKSLETFDFTATPSVGKQQVLELARGDWIRQHYNCCLLGNSGTGKTHLAEGLGRAACHEGFRVRFFTAAALVNKLEEAHQHHQLDRLLAQLGRRFACGPGVWLSCSVSRKPRQRSKRWRRGRMRSG